MLTYPGELPNFRFCDIHHVYWTAEWWKHYANEHTGPEREVIKEFRDGTPQKMYVPRAVHEHIERVMLKPKPPSIEVMDRRNKAWSAASILLANAVRLDKAREELCSSTPVVAAGT